MNFILIRLVVMSFAMICLSSGLASNRNASDTISLKANSDDISIQRQELMRKMSKIDGADAEGDDDYNDYVDEDESTKRSKQRNITIAQRVGITYAWAKWDKWSKCSRACVQIKRRKCIKREQNDTDSEAVITEFYPDLLSSTSTGCFGLLKRYRVCKDAKCKMSNKQLRNEQCSGFNKSPYRGKFYNWIGYEKEHNECELFCRPSDSDIFISMNQSVTDGTPCEKPSVYYTHAFRRRAVCVEGICKILRAFDFGRSHLNIAIDGLNATW